VDDIWWEWPQRSVPATNETLDAVNETAQDFYDHGHIDQMTMRYFDVICLTPIHKFDALAVALLSDVMQIVLLLLK
jgi:hypothetical protein